MEWRKGMKFFLHEERVAFSGLYSACIIVCFSFLVSGYSSGSRFI